MGSSVAQMVKNLPAMQGTQIWSLDRKESLEKGMPFLPPGNLADPGVKPAFLASPALAGRFLTLVPHGEPINITHDPIKFLEEKIGKTFSDINFLGYSPSLIEIKAKINKLHLIKLISFYTRNENINKMKKACYWLGEILADNANGRGLISKISKSWYNSITKIQLN